MDSFMGFLESLNEQAKGHHYKNQKKKVNESDIGGPYVDSPNGVPPAAPIGRSPMPFSNSKADVSRMEREYDLRELGEMLQSATAAMKQIDMIRGVTGMSQGMMPRGSNPQVDDALRKVRVSVGSVLRRLQKMKMDMERGGISQQM